jgi:hypothetical protein
MKNELRECGSGVKKTSCSTKILGKLCTGCSKRNIETSVEWPDLLLPPINLWNAPTQFWIDNMSLTEKDIAEKLATLGEIDLLEILDISSEELVARFPDKIEERRDYFEADLEDE